MIVNQATLAAITKSFQVIFDKTLVPLSGDLGRIATTIPSSSGSEDVPIGALLATIREWFGDRVIQNIAAWTKNIPNRDFESTVGVKKTHIEDDKIGVYSPAIQTLGQKASIYPYELALEELDTYGWTASGHAGYDTKAFFASDHTWPGGKYTTAQNNTTTETLDAAAVKTGIAAMAGFRGPDGKLLASKPNVFVCGTALQWTAKQLFVPGNQADADDHTLVGTFSPENILIEPRLTALHWMMLDCRWAVKPVVYVNRKSPVLTGMTDLTDEQVFTSGNFRYGVDFRGAAACVAWWLGYGSTGAE